MVLLLGLLLTSAADAELVGWWRLDEGTGTVAADSSGNGRDGTIYNATWETGQRGGALAFDGTAHVELPADAWSTIEMQASITFWAYGDPAAQPQANFIFGAFQDAANNDSRVMCAHVPWSNGNVYFDTGGTTAGGYDRINKLATAEEYEGAWQHWALVKNAETGDQQIYLNGVLWHSGSGMTRPMTGVTAFTIGTKPSLAEGWYYGMMDDVRLYDHALTEAEIAILAAREKAEKPDPADGAKLEQTWVALGWKPGGFSVSSDVYMSDNFDDVNDGAAAAFQGNFAAPSLVVGFFGFPFPDGLAPGTTYYWRVDAIDEANPDSPWKGDVWSFWIPPKSAYDPGPSDGARFILAEPTLSWGPGYEAMLHYVYFGDNFDEVSNATAGTPSTETTYDPGILESGKTYYWRVDESSPPNPTVKGDVWSFTTVPDIPITDPNLVGWWKFDEGQGRTAVDWSGHGNHGTIETAGDPLWVDGYDLGAMDMAGAAYVSISGESWSTIENQATIALWVYGDPDDMPRNNSAFYAYDGGNRVFQAHIPWGDGRVYFDTGGPAWSSNRIDKAATAEEYEGSWRHWTFVKNASTGDQQIYLDGVLWHSGTGMTDTMVNVTSFTIGSAPNGGNIFPGMIDDVRLYNNALTTEEIALVMRGDPKLAWVPSPADGSTPDVDNALPLSWSAGDEASSHEVYFGADADAVENADTSDTTGVYRGRQNGTSFTPAEGVEWGAGPFYWRIDENNADGTVTKGRIWSFTVADFLLVDDFESYTDNDPENEAIWQHWIDGYGVPTNGSESAYPVPPYAEQTIVHGGGQSMPLQYNNTAGVRNSEVVLTLSDPRDWTAYGVGALSLWFRGYPPSVGSFTQGAGGVVTMTGSGSDIWGTADHFHFAYKTLTGPGTIIARVDSVENTNVWAKAGVMIRESLEPDSTYAFSLVSAASGVAFQGRTDTATGAVGTTEADIAAPHWVKLERDVAGNFTASHSTNGSTWVPVSGAVPLNIPMASEVYIGLALTSHNASATCEAKFSNVTVTGNVGAQWVNQDVGILANNAEPLYVSLSNANGTPVVLANDDPDAATITEWTEWVIDLQAFADQGVNLADIDKIAIGLGSTGDPAAAGGSGTVFIDDITLVRPVAEQPVGN